MASGRRVLVSGGIYLDHFHRTSADIRLGKSMEIIEKKETLGGPGLCIATALSRLELNTSLYSIIGTCQNSKTAISWLSQENITWVGESFEGEEIDNSYLFESNSCNARVVFNSYSLSSELTPHNQVNITSWDFFVIMSPSNLPLILNFIKKKNIRIPSLAVVHSKQLRKIKKPLDLKDLNFLIISESDEEDLNYEKFKFNCIITTKGDAGCVIKQPDKSDIEIPIKLEKKIISKKLKSTNGAGEAFAAGFIAFFCHHETLLNQNKLSSKNIIDAVKFAQKWAAQHISNGGNLNFPYLSTLF